MALASKPHPGGPVLVGDIKGNVEKVRMGLLRLRFPMEEFDAVRLPLGYPPAFLRILHFLFLECSPFISNYLAEEGIELFYKCDRRFLEEAWRALRRLFNYRPAISVAQFLTTSGYPERKLILCQDVIFLAKKLHNQKCREAASSSLSARRSVASRRSRSPSLSARNSKDGQSPRHSRSAASPPHVPSTPSKSQSRRDKENESLRQTSEPSCLLFSKRDGTGAREKTQDKRKSMTSSLSTASPRREKENESLRQTFEPSCLPPLKREGTVARQESQEKREAAASFPSAASPDPTRFYKVTNLSLSEERKEQNITATAEAQGHISWQLGTTRIPRSRDGEDQRAFPLAAVHEGNSAQLRGKVELHGARQLLEVENRGPSRATDTASSQAVLAAQKTNNDDDDYPKVPPVASPAIFLDSSIAPAAPIKTVVTSPPSHSQPCCPAEAKREIFSCADRQTSAVVDHRIGAISAASIPVGNTESVLQEVLAMRQDIGSLAKFVGSVVDKINGSLSILDSRLGLIERKISGGALQQVLADDDCQPSAAPRSSQSPAPYINPVLDAPGVRLPHTTPFPNSPYGDGSEAPASSSLPTILASASAHEGTAHYLTGSSASVPSFPSSEISHGPVFPPLPQSLLVAGAVPGEYNYPASSFREKAITPGSSCISDKSRTERGGNELTTAGKELVGSPQQRDTTGPAGSETRDVRDIDRFMEAEVSRVSLQIQEIQSALRSSANFRTPESSQPLWHEAVSRDTQQGEAIPFLKETGTRGDRLATGGGQASSPSPSHIPLSAPTAGQTEQRELNRPSMSSASSQERLNTDVRLGSNGATRHWTESRASSTAATGQAELSTKREQMKLQAPSSLQNVPRSDLHRRAGGCQDGKEREKHGWFGRMSSDFSAEPEGSDGTGSHAYEAKAEASKSSVSALPFREQKSFPKDGSASTGDLADSIGFSGPGSDVQSTGFLLSSNGSYDAMRKTPAFGLRSSWGSGSACSSSRDLVRPRLFRGVSAGNFREFEGFNMRQRPKVFSSQSEENFPLSLQHIREGSSLPMVSPTWHSKSSSSTYDFGNLAAEDKTGSDPKQQDAGDPGKIVESTSGHVAAERATMAGPWHTHSSRLGDAVASSAPFARDSKSLIEASPSNNRGMEIFSRA